MSKTKQSRSRRKAAFTLIELLVVVSVLGVLFAIVLPNLIGTRSRARDVAIKSDLNQLKTALRLYYNDFQSYPNDNGGGSMMGCGSAGNAACPNANGSFAVGAAGNETVYMSEMPAAADFNYSQEDGGDNYLLAAPLENVSDQDAANSADKCNVSSPVAGTYYVCAE